MKLKDYIWPVVGVSAVVLSGWILYEEVRGLSLDDILESFQAISHLQWAASAASAILAYALLAYYDRLALLQLHKPVPILFVAATSFTTYALSHNVGASVFSGAVVRYRAYTSKGLRMSDVALLIAFCSFTYALGILLVGAFCLVISPEILERFFEVGPRLGIVLALGIFAVLGLYVLGSLFRFRPLTIGKFRLEYPRPPIVLRQLVAAPLEIIAAAGIIYFALPPETNPGFVVVLAVFIASFSLALISHAPGGLGVLELAFIAGLGDVPERDVLAALLVFRILYLLVPFALSLLFILAFEQRNIRWRRRAAGSGGKT